MKEYIFNKDDILKAFVSKSKFNFKSITLFEKISCGGFGCVYKVKFSDIDKYLCIKIQKSQKFIDRFEKLFNERNIVNMLQGYIPDIYEIGKMKINNYNLSYIIMEYYPYPSLHVNKINNKQVCKLFIFLLQFMNILHINNLSYPDIKPDNIIALNDNTFRVIDIETIIPLITPPNIDKTIISTKKFDLSNKSYYSSHQLNQLISCIYTCLDIMGMYPNCNGKYVYPYANYLINFAIKMHIDNANKLEDLDVFNNIFNVLYNYTNSVLYTLLSMIYMYILLIPQYTISYINASFWYSIFLYYSKYVTNDKPKSQFCDIKNVKQHVTLITGFCPQSHNESVNIEAEVRKIPRSINIDIYKKCLNEYIKIQKQTFDKLPPIIKNTSKYQRINPYNINNKYYIFNQDPRALFFNTFYNYI